MSNIFADNARAYWDAGLPAIPLRPVHKAPIPSGWQNFCSMMPPPDTQQAWLRQFPNSNVGLALGPAAGLVAIDLDTDDPRITEVIEALIPKTPWVRRGKKGAVYLFKSPASGEHRTFRIRTLQGKSLVECLAKGTQIVLPPSIHPDTLKPYVATCELPKVLALLPALPRDIEAIIRGALSEEGITLSTRGSAKMVEWVAAGNRDSSMTSIAGLEARAVVRAERTLAEAFGEIETWIANFTEKVAGDAVDPAKGRAKIVEFVKRDLFEGKRSLPTGWDEGLSEQEREAAAKEFGEDNEEWSVERCMEYLDAQFELHERRSKGRITAVEQVLLRMSQSRLTEIEKESVIGYIHACSSEEITVSTLRRRLKELEKGAIEGANHTQIAEILIKELSRYGEIRIAGDKIWQWRGSHWDVLPDNRLIETIAREFGDVIAARKFYDHSAERPVDSRNQLCEWVSHSRPQIASPQAGARVHLRPAVLL